MRVFAFLALQINDQSVGRPDRYHADGKFGWKLKPGFDRLLQHSQKPSILV